MGSATNQALTEVRQIVANLGTKATLAVAEEVFAAGAVLSSSAQLLSTLTDTAIDSSAKAGLLAKLFPKHSAESNQVLNQLVDSAWSAGRDLLAGVEEAGIRLAAANEQADITSELYAFGKVASSNAELELTLGSKLSAAQAKQQIIDQLLAGKVSKATAAILRYSIAFPRGRRLVQIVDDTAQVIGASQGTKIAKVTAATKLADDKLAKLEQDLSTSLGGKIKVILSIDPKVLGGLRIQIGNDVIDGTIAAKLQKLRLQLVS